MKNNPSDFDDEFNQKVILVLEDNKTKFVTDWSKNKTELKKNISLFWDTKIGVFGHQLLKIIAGISIIFLLLLSFFGFDWFIADEASFNIILKNYLIVFVAYFGSILGVISYAQSKNKGIDLFHENNDEKSLIDSDIGKTDGVFSGFKNFLQDAQEVVCNTIPTYKDINDLQRIKEKRYVECYKLKKVTTYFGLVKLEGEIVDFTNNSINECKGSDELTIRKSIIALVCKKSSCDATLMNLLVSYYYGEINDVETYWKTVKTDKKLLGQIASIVWKLNIFNFYENIDEVDDEILIVDDLKLILSKTQKFEQSLIMNNVLLYIRIYKFLLNYRGKLATENKKCSKEKINRINLRKQLTKKEIIDNIDFSNDFVPNCIDIFSKELHESLEIDSKNAYVDALMAIILSPDINFREKVCEKVSENNEAIYVLTAYYDLRERKGALNEQFSLFEIIDKEQTATIKEKIKDSRKYEILFERIRLALSNGEWCESSQTIIQSKVEEILDKLDKNEINEKLVKIFAKYFTKININTLDMAVDAGLFTIYLILVPKSSEGSFLTGIIDKLSVSVPKNKYMNKNTQKRDDSTRNFNYKVIKKFEDDYDVSLFLDSDIGISEPKIPIYDFENYSFATRIGIAHREISFTTFVDRFNKDVEKVLRKEVEENPSQEWEKITFIILRISPSEYSFGLMDDKISIEGVKSFGNLDLAEKIATLASTYLTEQQKTAVATFENDINFNDIFEKMTIFEILSSNIQQNVKKYSVFLKDENFNNLIREHLKAYDIESFRQLSNRLSLHPDTYSELKKSLSSLIAEEYKKQNDPPLNKYTLDDIVSDFLDSIKSMHDMWTHEAFK